MVKLRPPERYLANLIFAFIAGVMAFSANVSAPITDNFHEGEFLGFIWHMRDYHQGLAPFPLLVHGGMDYLLAQLGVALFGIGHAIVGTHIVLLLLTAVQYFLLMHSCALLLGDKAQRPIWIGLILLYFYLVTPQFDASVIEASYFPVRDLFLSLTLWCLIKSALTSGIRHSRLFLAAGAIATACALFWCYNRGVIALAFVGVFWLGLVLRRRVGNAILLPLVLLATLAIFDQLKWCGTLRENADNVLYWLQYGSDVNHLRFKPEYFTEFAGLAALCLLATSVLALALSVRRKHLFENDLLVFIVIGLFVVQTLNIKIIFGVPDLEYSLHGGWPSVMLLLIYGSRLLTVTGNVLGSPLSTLDCFLADGNKQTRLAMKVVGASLLVYFIFCHHHIFVPYARFTKNVIWPVANEQMLSPDIVELSRLAGASPDECYFNWVNDGVVAFLAQKQLCTDYPYGHYVAASLDQTLLTQLQGVAPTLIVVDSDFWPFTRHLERMDERLPATARFIAEHYGRQSKIGRYQIVFKKP